MIVLWTVDQLGRFVCHVRIDNPRRGQLWSVTLKSVVDRVDREMGN